MTEAISYLEHLNESQRAAVEYLEGPELVIAGAGSGKTRVLTYKIVHLVHSGIRPDNILALTFTNKAAREMQGRIEKLAGEHIGRRLWMGTFHSIFLRILRRHSDRINFRHDFTIYDAADSKSLVKMIIKEMGLDENQYKPSAVASIISNAKNALVSPEQFSGNYGDYERSMPMLQRIYMTYCTRCRLAQAMDFDDILYFMNVLLRDNDDIRDFYNEYFEYVLVDEFQDTNFAQSLIIHQLTKKRRRLCVVGDDAQSIYSFRGANINNILQMERRYPDLKTYKLELNYRSTQTIINAAGSVIRHNISQIPKNLHSDNPVGQPIEVIGSLTDYEEAAFVAAALSRKMRSTGSDYSDFAILYRTNSQSRQLEEALRRRSIPYRIYGGLTFYQRKEVRDAICYFRLVVNIDDDEALRRIINFPARGIGETTMKKIQQAAVNHQKSYWQILLDPLHYGVELNKGTLKKLENFTGMIKEFRADKEVMENAYAMGQNVFNRTGLLLHFSHETTPEEISKHENLNELLNGLKEFVDFRKKQGIPDVSMSAFLSEVSLLTDLDSEDVDDKDKVTLMTVHAAKGLEFSHVIITGMEEDLFPSSQSKDSITDIEEERRLFYVALTRAKKTCTITYAKSRFRKGATNAATLSRFVYEIDPKYLKNSGNISSAPYTQKGYPATDTYRTAKSFDNGMADGNRFRNRDSFGGDLSSEVPASILPVRKLRKILKPVAGQNKTVENALDMDSQATFRPKPSGISLKGELKPGTKVSHARFGKGEVVELMSEPDSMVVVKFENFGQKKLLLRFAKLDII